MYLSLRLRGEMSPLAATEGGSPYFLICESISLSILSP